MVQRFLPSRSRGGVGVFAHGLACALASRGHDVTLFSEDPAPDRAPYRVVAVPAGQGRLGPLAFPFALRRCDFQAFDLIHSQGDEQWLPRRRPPVVRTMHGTALAEAWFNGVRGRSLTRFLLHSWFYLGESLADLRADAVIAVSRHTARFYPRVDAVIPNGIDLDAWAPDGTPKSNVPSILFVGEVDSRKRGRFLADVFSREVRSVLRDAELWLVSPDRVEGAGIVWRGTLSDAALQSLMRQAWVMCLPSAYEGFGRPYAEAMAAGTAVVSTVNPGAREVLEDGRAGVLVSDGELGRTLVRVLSTTDERRELERRGLERAKAFGWPVVAEVYERVYEQAIAARSRRRLANRP